jgi:maltose/moltooligosaccharide transporter
MGYLIRDVFHEQAIYALVIGGISMVIGGILNVIVRDDDEKVAYVIPMELVNE